MIGSPRKNEGRARFASLDVLLLNHWEHIKGSRLLAGVFCL